MRKKKFNWLLGMITILLAGTASWALYHLINMSAGDLLIRFGIENAYAQAGIVFGSIFIIFLLTGFGLKKSMERILK